MIGKTVAQYEITSALGKGGIGEVFLARDTKLDREVALKFLPEPLQQDEKEEGYPWLQRSIGAGWRYYDITSQDPIWADFHGGPRFQQIIAEVKAKVDVMRVRVREMEKK